MRSLLIWVGVNRTTSCTLGALQMKVTATCRIQKFRWREKNQTLVKILGGRQHRTTPAGQILGVATPAPPAALTPMDLDQLSYMAGHVINTAKKLEDPMPIRSWVMSYNRLHLPLVTIENAFLDYCACVGGKFCRHFWNHPYWFVYSLWNFSSSTTKVNQRYMPK